METDRLSRRGFIGVAGIAAGGAVLAACAPTEETPTNYPPTGVPKPTATLRPTKNPEPSPIATEISYQLEDGTQIQRVKEGQLIDLFPESEVFMSERGDVVVVNEETGLKVAGQRVETDYGSYTLLFEGSFYQDLYLAYAGETTTLGGYPNIAESPIKQEIGRICSTLLELRSRDIGFDTDFTTHQPKEKNAVAVFMSMGSTGIIASSVEKGLVDINELEKVSELEVAFPPKELGPDGLLLTSFRLTAIPTSLSEDMLTSRLSRRYIVDLFSNLVKEAAAANGMDTSFVLGGYRGIKQSAFSGLFANEEIEGAYDAINRTEWTPEERDLKAGFSVPNIVTVDFSKFTNIP